MNTKDRNSSPRKPQQHCQPCQKVAYRRRIEAESAIRAIEKDRRRDPRVLPGDDPMRPRSFYLCQHKLFHLTKKDTTFVLPAPPDVSDLAEHDVDERAVYTERVETLLGQEIERVGPGQPFPAAREIANHYGLRPDRVERMRIRLVRKDLLVLIDDIPDQGYYTRGQPPEPKPAGHPGIPPFESRQQR